MTGDDIGQGLAMLGVLALLVWIGRRMGWW